MITCTLYEDMNIFNISPKSSYNEIYIKQRLYRIAEHILYDQYEFSENWGFF